MISPARGCPSCARLPMGQAVASGFGCQLGGEGGQDADLVLGPRRQQSGGAPGLEVQRGPQLTGDVGHVQAQVVLGPARAQGGEVAAGGMVPEYPRVPGHEAQAGERRTEQVRRS